MDIPLSLLERLEECYSSFLNAETSQEELGVAVEAVVTAYLAQKFESDDFWHDWMKSRETGPKFGRG